MIGHSDHCSGCKGICDTRPYFLNQTGDRVRVETLLANTQDGGQCRTTGGHQCVEIGVERDAGSLFGPCPFQDGSVVGLAHANIGNMHHIASRIGKA